MIVLENIAPADVPSQSGDVLELQLDRFVRSSAAQRKWAEGALQCLEYDQGTQWRGGRAKPEKRPALTINRIAPLVRLILGYFEQNEYDRSYKPGGLAPGTQDIAELLGKVDKSICLANQARWHAAEVFYDAVTTGRGFRDYRIDYYHNALGEVRESVLNPFCVRIDPDAEDYDPETWGYVQIDSWLSLQDIAAIYGTPAAQRIVPSAPAQDVPGIGNGSQAGLASRIAADGAGFVPPRGFGRLSTFLDSTDVQWGQAGSIDDHVNRMRRIIRCIETQHRVWALANVFVDPRSGRKVECPMWWGLDHIDRVMQWAQMRGIDLRMITEPRRMLRTTVTAGNVVLHDDWSPYRSLTVVPTFGFHTRGSTRGMVHDLIDPQDEINKRRSVFLHIAMSAANSGWMVEDGSLDPEMMAALEEIGATPGLVVRYGQGRRPPEKIQPTMPAQALERLELAAAEDLLRISNINDSALGQLDRVQSGRAILARQRQAVIGNEWMFTSFSRSQFFAGRKILELVQDHYTEERILVVDDASGGAGSITINKRVAADTIANDITESTYDVVIAERPMADTFEEAQYTDLIDATREGIIPAALVADIIVDASSMPQKEEIKRRIDALQQQQVAAATAATPTAAGVPPAGGPPTPSGTPPEVNVR